MAKSATLLLVWATVLGIQLTLVMSYVNVEFRARPALITPLKTANVSLECLAKEITRYFDESNNDLQEEFEFSTNHFGNSSQQNGIVMIQILKNFQAKWQPIALIRNNGPNTAQKLDSSISNTRGTLSDDRQQQSFIQVTWDLATVDAFGEYRCEAISVDSQQNTVYRTMSELSLGNTLGALDLLRLLKYDLSGILGRVHDGQRELRSNKNLTKQLENKVSMLKAAASAKQNKLTDKVEEQRKLLISREERLQARISDIQKGITQKLDEIIANLYSAFDSKLFMPWPRGTYALLKPASGCPFIAKPLWETGWRRHHTESSYSNYDTLSTNIHLQQPILERTNGNNFVTQHFCVKTTNLSIEPIWPNGSYCINKKGNCPDMFNEGSIILDEEDIGSNGTFGGEIPDGYLIGAGDSTIIYCCRQDGSLDNPIHLPIFSPFYLYRYGGRCQQVKGMFVTEEYVVIDTENNSNRDLLGQVHPDGTSNPIRLQLCYYERS